MSVAAVCLGGGAQVPLVMAAHAQRVYILASHNAAEIVHPKAMCQSHLSIKHWVYRMHVSRKSYRSWSTLLATCAHHAYFAQQWRLNKAKYPRLHCAHRAVTTTENCEQYPSSHNLLKQGIDNRHLFRYTNSKSCSNFTPLTQLISSQQPHLLPCPPLLPHLLWLKLTRHRLLKKTN